MSKAGLIRVGIFDQIVSGGGVRFFTTKLLEEFSRQAKGRWHFHLMWPCFDSSDQFLPAPRLARTSFERIEIDRALLWKERIALSLAARTTSNLGGRRFFGGLEQRSDQIRRNEQQRFRSGDGSGLRWLDERMKEFDLVFIPYPYLTLPLDGNWKPAKPVVITLHDLAHEFTDTWGETTMRLRNELRAWSKLARLIVFSSDFVRGEAQKIYQIPPESTRTILLSPTKSKYSPDNSRSTLNRYKLKEGYIFTLGWAAKHKRLATIIKGFALFRDRSRQDISLVIAGPGTSALAEMNLAGLEIGREVFGLGYVRDEDIPALYHGASAVITASTSEAGLNTVIFDAMNQERAIICSDIPPFVERLGRDDNLAIIFDPNSPEALAEALAKHFADPASARRRTSQAKRFINERSLAKVGADYLRAFEDVL